MSEASWNILANNEPGLAEFGQKRIDGQVAYLATVKKNGQPRAHPVTPIVGEGHCFVFVESGSAKSGDLLDNGYYCLHCAMNDSSGSSGEFQISGRAKRIEDPSVRVLAESVASYRPSARAVLFELQVSEAISTEYRGGKPIRRKWLAATVV